ncbi:MAG: hypothetical protein QUS14_00500 [Pyrinomonadaceae bacterium]|nr:hypothetical protein [Pyrinomonadaceae bacterium]
MLVIRQSQLETLMRGGEDRFVEHLVGHIKSEDPEISTEYTDDELRNMVRLGIRKSEGYGFKLSADQSAFVAIMFEVAPNFDSQPEIRSVLEENGLTPSARLEKLWSEAVPDSVWDKASEEYDESAWENPARSTEVKS